MPRMQSASYLGAIRERHARVVHISLEISNDTRRVYRRARVPRSGEERNGLARAVCNTGSAPDICIIFMQPSPPPPPPTTGAARRRCQPGVRATPLLFPAKFAAARKEGKKTRIKGRGRVFPCRASIQRQSTPSARARTYFALRDETSRCAASVRYIDSRDRDSYLRSIPEISDPRKEERRERERERELADRFWIRALNSIRCVTARSRH